MSLFSFCNWRQLNRAISGIHLFPRHFSSSTSLLQVGPPASTKNSPKKKYSDTVILPKTNFPPRIAPDHRKEHEVALAARLKFDQLYASQLQWRRDQPEYILHDGPPYANGEAHIGHAVNKILKDITNRYKLLRGYRVNYRAGWDCHGLPIELKSSKSLQLGLHPDPAHVRDAARSVANESIAKQMEAFQRWGIMADWSKPYKTFDKDYIKAQLQMFYVLHEKGLLYRDLKPVYWSPSSHTALAEAELEYVSNHESTAIHLSLDLNLNLEDFSSTVGFMLPEQYTTSAKSPVKAVIWTTTPWSLPANTGVAYHSDEKYSLVFLVNSHPEGRIYYVVASKLVPQLEISLGRVLTTVTEFSGQHFENLTYRHPWFEERVESFFHSTHVTMDKGTGLVHIAPAHGPDDFLLALKHKLPIECYVDDEGNFDSRLGSLKGLPAMTGGNNGVLMKLKENILHKEKYPHSYPYDWRTKKPVLIKASMQWFMNTQQLKERAAEALSKISIHPKNVQNGMLAQVMSRPYWCISRQRVWGVPIPVLYHKETGEPIIDKKIIDRLCDIVEGKGNLDSWWTTPPSVLMQNADADAHYEKGKDIFDIWLDSGISWHLLDGKIADLCVEGLDQFTGWFQSSLLLSLAVRDCAPYKNLFVHGFVVDEENKKMSKSLGNVVNPTKITDGDMTANRKAFGVDVLRWWVATQGSEGSNMSMSITFLRSAEESIQKLRQVLRFLVSFANEAANDELDIDDVTYDELEYMDQYMLTLLHKFQKEVTENYDAFAFHRVMMKAIHFSTVSVSAHYFTWIKDRLYCDRKDSQSRKSTMFVLNQIYLTLMKTLAPVLPFLTEESYSYYSSVQESLFKYTWFNVEEEWDNAYVHDLFSLAMDIRTSFNHIVGENDQKQVWVEIICNQNNFKMLQVLHPDECNSELCDILQVSGVSLQCSDQASFTTNPYGVSHSLNGFSVGVSKTEKMQCARCRRFCCNEGDVLCSRCAGVLKISSGRTTTERENVVEIPPTEIRGRT